MIRCIAIDAEPAALKRLETYITRVPFLQLVGSCRDAVSARKYIEENIVDAVFMDINLPGENGIELARSLVTPPILVLISDKPDYALEGYKLNAADYLLKPYSQDSFIKAAEKVRLQYILRSGAVSVSGADYDDAIFFKTDYKVVRVSIPSIICVEGMSEYLKIHTDSQDSQYVILMSMKKLEDRLPSSFMRIHKSYIINLKKINEVSRGRVSLQNGMIVPIGDMYKEEFQAYLDSKFLGK